LCVLYGYDHAEYGHGGCVYLEGYDNEGYAVIEVIFMQDGHGGCFHLGGGGYDHEGHGKGGCFHIVEDMTMKDMWS